MKNRKLFMPKKYNLALTLVGLAVIAFFTMGTRTNLVSKPDSIYYIEDEEDFANPERGFYVVGEGAPGNLSSEKLEKLRTEYSIKTRSANYALSVTLVYRDYLLGDFVDSDISEAYLTKIQEDFKAIRKAGLKAILRFAYINRSKKGDCPDGSICPPYGDAPKEIILKHIAQLEPILRENSDVIAVLQQGFIGIWGENYFTDYFGDASSNGDGVILDHFWEDRNEVLKHLLDAMPKSRMVQVRTPQMKQRFVYGPKAPVTSAPLTSKAAFSQSDEARIGMHNDCFLASADDYGTYNDNGNSSSPSRSANEVLRKYFEADSRYTAIGGETCDDAYSPQNDCAPFGHAEQEMAAMHYSYLNANYNNLVNNDWEEQGCMLNIKRKLGYRFVLEKAAFPSRIKSGNSFKTQIQLKNIGYASPFNPRDVELVLRNTKTNELTLLPLSVNVQHWSSGIIELNRSVTLPKNLQEGQYELLLNLPDADSSLRNRPEYSIRFANINTWEPETGFNKLHHILIVEK